MRRQPWPARRFLATYAARDWPVSRSSISSRVGVAMPQSVATQHTKRKYDTPDR